MVIEFVGKAVTAVCNKVKGGMSQEPEELVAPSIKEYPTRRISMRELHTGERFLMSMRKNPREYAWNVEEGGKFQVIQMFDSIVENTGHDLLHLGLIYMTEVKPEFLTEQMQSVIKDRPTALWLNVREGQQRITTATIIFLVIRNDLKRRLKCGEINQQDDWKAKGILEEINSFISPKYAEYQPVPRIVTRSGLLERMILTNIETSQPAQSEDSVNYPNPDSEVNCDQAVTSIATPAKSKNSTSKRKLSTQKTMESRVSKKLKSKIKAESADEKLEKAYLYIQQRIEKMEISEVIRIFQNLANKTVVNVTTGMTDRECLQLVLNMQKGLDIEEVDHFKTCLIPEDDKNYEELQDRWIQLCQKVGRDTVKMASLFVAQIKNAQSKNGRTKQGELLRPSQYNNKYSLIVLIEEFARNTVPEVGSSMILNWIDSTARVLFGLQKGYFENDSINEGIFESLTDTLIAQVNVSFRLMRTVANDGTGNFINLAIVAILLMDIANEEKASILQKLEPITLWMLLTKPNKKVRENRMADLIKQLCNDSITTFDFLHLTENEIEQIKTSLNQDKFDTKEKGSKATKAILEYFNVIQLREQGNHTFMIRQDTFLEMIEFDDTKKCKLGNLILSINRSWTPKGKDVMECKIDRWKNCPFPLSKDAVTQWTQTKKLNSVVNHNTTSIKQIVRKIYSNLAVEAQAEV